MRSKYQPWDLARNDGTDCLHDWSVEVPIPRSELPAYVHGEAKDVYCSQCGVKQTLRDRILIETLKGVGKES